jgi:hypothetical protein
LLADGAHLLGTLVAALPSSTLTTVGLLPLKPGQGVTLLSVSSLAWETIARLAWK